MESKHASSRTASIRAHGIKKIKLTKQDYCKKNEEKIKMYFKEYYQEKRKNLTLSQSLQMFKMEIAWGSIFPCICCHRYCFINSVKRTNQELLTKYPIAVEAIEETYFQQDSKFLTKNSFWICITCLEYI